MKLQTKTDKVVLGVVIGAGVAIGLIATGVVAHYRNLCGDIVLKNVKKLFVMDKEIVGSWIELKPVKKIVDGQRLKVYNGGITCKEDGKIIQYKFVANAKSGVLIDFYELASG